MITKIMTVELSRPLRVALSNPGTHPRHLIEKIMNET